MVNILVVDDDPLLRNILGRILIRQGYRCSFAAEAAQARDILATQIVDLAFCDIEMPGESGIHLAAFIKSAYRETAVIILTSRDDTATADLAIEAGVDGYILKPFHTNELIINTRNALRKRGLEILNLKYRQHLEVMLDERTAKLERAVNSIFLALARMVETKDPYTAGHQLRVSALASAIYGEMGASRDQMEGIRLAGMIHDLGKISVPSDILAKPACLTKLEFELVRTHPRSGSDILSDLNFPWPIAEMILQHHERIDGSGYPQGLANGQILQEARILGVADVLEAMASFRPYRPALGLDKAFREIEMLKGKYYDPAVVEAVHRLQGETIEGILN